MKRVIYICVVSQIFFSCFAGKKNNSDISFNEIDIFKGKNKIDSLQTVEQVINFAKSINPDFARKNFGTLQIKSTELIVKELNNCNLYKNWDIPNWQKIDLNNDGKTDLLFTAYWYSSYRQYAILETGTDQYKLFVLHVKF